MKMEFKVDGKDYFACLPSARQEKDGMVVFAKTLTRCMSEGIMSNAKLDKYARDEGVWDDDKEKRKDELETALIEGKQKLDKGGIKFSEARKVAIDMRLKRLELIVLTLQRTKLASFTAEALADKERNDYFISCCIKSSDGTRVFNSLEDYQDKKTSELGQRAENAFYRLYQGLDEDFDKKLPESEFLIKNGFANENLELVDKDGNFVDIEGNLIKEPEKIEFQPFLEG